MLLFLPESHFKASPAIARDLAPHLYVPGAGNKAVARESCRGLKPQNLLGTEPPWWLFYEKRGEQARPRRDGTTAADCCGTRAAHVTAHRFINIHFTEKNLLNNIYIHYILYAYYMRSNILGKCWQLNEYDRSAVPRARQRSPQHCIDT